jgi:hypothetical protein
VTPIGLVKPSLPLLYGVVHQRIACGSEIERGAAPMAATLRVHAACVLDAITA